MSNDTPTMSNQTTSPEQAPCSACGQYPKFEKTAIPEALQLSHLCPMGRDNDFGEFGAETELVTLWNNQQNPRPTVSDRSA